MKFGKALKILRSVKEMTQSEVANAVHMEERTYREVESDRRALSAKEIAVFAQFFQVDVQLIYDIAQDSAPVQNIVHEARRDGIVIHHGKTTEAHNEVVHYLLQRIKDLEEQLLKYQQSIS